MRLNLVLGVLGKILRLFSLAFVPPLLLSAWDAANGAGEWMGTLRFLGAAAIAVVCGSLLGRLAPKKPDYHRAEALAVVAGAWLLIGVFAAVPFWFEGLGALDGLFESVSGLTTTGVTMLTDFTVHDRAFFLWRSMIQWFGGLGVIALFVLVLPELGIAGRQIFFAEASEAGHDLMSPRLRGVARRLWALYVGLTLTEVVLLATVAGLPVFDAVCNSLTTMPAGGFSPNPQSIGGYGSPAADWIVTAFMAIAGMSFPLIWLALFRTPRVLGRDGEFRFYLGTMVATSAGVALLLAGGLPDAETIRHATFSVVSLISATGFANNDWGSAPWTDASRACLVIPMVVGGCAGSAAGGAKVVRYVLTLKFMGRELSRSLHPRGVLPIRHKGRPVPEEAMRAILNVVLLFLATYTAIGFFLVLRGNDFVTSFTASIACVGNIGLGLGQAGPAESLAGLDPASKFALMLGMWAGRLEIVTVLALLHPDVLRRLRWGRREKD